MSLRALRPCESILYFSKKTVISQRRRARGGKDPKSKTKISSPDTVVHTYRNKN